MIAYLKGQILVVKDKYVVVKTGDIGYKVFVGEVTAHALLEKNIHEAEFFIFHRTSETATELYGFLSFNVLELFELLISVSGVGPKTALAIVDGTDRNEIIGAIARKDITLLSSFPGVGKKTAERIATDLADKMPVISVGDALIGQKRSGNDLVDALVSLGFRPNDARQALSMVDSNIEGENEIIKVALKFLSR